MVSESTLRRLLKKIGYNVYIREGRFVYEWCPIFFAKKTVNDVSATFKVKMKENTEDERLKALLKLKTICYECEEA